MNSNANHTDNKIVKFATLDPKVQNLLIEAVQARELSYSPYTKFKVGACLMTKDGKIYRGCNVENASFTVGTCAERTAYFKAISEGDKSFSAIAVVAYQDTAIPSPCGACRQLMSEFGNIDVYMSKPKLDEVLVTSLDELLPYSFQAKEDQTL